MEEYEVDLRDYLRVIWRKKWLILGVFLVAIGAALLVSFRMPSQYEATALVRLNSLPQIDRVRLQAPSFHEVMIILKVRGLLKEALKELESGLPGPEGSSPRGLSLKAEIPEKDLLKELGLLGAQGAQFEPKVIELKLKGPLEPHLLEVILEACLHSLGETLRGDLSADAKEEIARLSTEMEVLQGQREELLEELDREAAEYKETLEKQRDELRQELAQIEQAKEKLGLQAGEQNATLEGIILRERFIALNARLQQVERELADLELRGYKKFPELYAQIQALDRELRELQATVELTQRLLNPGPGSGWEPFEVLGQPAAPPGPIGPNRRMNVAVAGVLGLFVGVLLAFFVHYMEGERVEREAVDHPAEGRSTKEMEKEEK